MDPTTAMDNEPAPPGPVPLPGLPSSEEADEAIQHGADFVERISILLDETNYAKKAFLKQNAVERAYL